MAEALHATTNRHRLIAAAAVSIVEMARVAPQVWSDKPADVTLMDEDFAAEQPQLLRFGAG